MHRKVNKITKYVFSVENCTMAPTEHSKRAVRGPNFEICNSNLTTHSLYRLYNLVETLFSHKHTREKHCKVDKITKNVVFSSKYALSALQSTQNEQLEGQNLKASTQTWPQVLRIDSTTWLKHFSHTNMPVKSTAKSTKSQKTCVLV